MANRNLGSLSVSFIGDIKSLYDAARQAEEVLTSVAEKVASIGSLGSNLGNTSDTTRFIAAISQLSQVITNLGVQFGQVKQQAGGAADAISQIDDASRSAAQNARNAAQDMQESFGNAAKTISTEFINVFQNIETATRNVAGQFIKPQTHVFQDAAFARGAQPLTDADITAFQKQQDQLAAIKSTARKNDLTQAEIAKEQEVTIEKQGLDLMRALQLQFVHDIADKIDAQRINQARQAWGQIAQIGKQIIQETGRDVIGVGVSGRELPELARNLNAVGQATRGLLGIPENGSFFNKLFGNFGQSLEQALAIILRFQAARVLIDALTNSFTILTKTGVEFQDVMQQVAAVVGDQTVGSLKILSDAARDVGRNTIVSATEAAKGLQILAQAGFTAQQSAEALPSLIKLSVGGVASIEQSANLLTSTLDAFDVKVERSDEIVNILVATVNKSKSSIDELNTAFNFAGTAAASAGLSVKDLGAIVGVLADNGVRASTQGTAVRQVISGLLEPSQKFKEILKALNIDIADIDPRFHDIVEILNTLRESGFGIAEAFQAFDRRAAAAFNILIQQADGVERLRNRISGTDAATLAFTTRQESLQAQLTISVNKFKDLAITLEEDLLGPATSVVKVFNSLLDVLGKFPAVTTGLVAGLAGAGIFKLLGGLTVLPTQLAAISGSGFTNTAKGIAGVSAALAQLGINLGIAANASTSAKVVAANLAVASEETGVLATAWGSLTAVFAGTGPFFAVAAAIALVVAGIEHFINQQAILAKQNEQTKERIQDNVQSINELTGEYRAAVDAVNKAKDGTFAHAAAEDHLRAVQAKLIEQFPEMGTNLELLASRSGDAADKVRAIALAIAQANEQAKIIREDQANRGEQAPPGGPVSPTSSRLPGFQEGAFPAPEGPSPAAQNKLADVKELFDILQNANKEASDFKSTLTDLFNTKGEEATQNAFAHFVDDQVKSLNDLVQKSSQFTQEQKDAFAQHQQSIALFALQGKISEQSLQEILGDSIKVEGQFGKFARQVTDQINEAGDKVRTLLNEGGTGVDAEVQKRLDQLRRQGEQIHSTAAGLAERQQVLGLADASGFTTDAIKDEIAGISEADKQAVAEAWDRVLEDINTKVGSKLIHGALNGGQNLSADQFNQIIDGLEISDAKKNQLENQLQVFLSERDNIIQTDENKILKIKLDAYEKDQKQARETNAQTERSIQADDIAAAESRAKILAAQGDQAEAQQTIIDAIKQKTEAEQEYARETIQSPAALQAKLEQIAQEGVAETTKKLIELDKIRLQLGESLLNKQRQLAAQQAEFEKKQVELQGQVEILHGAPAAATTEATQRAQNAIDVRLNEENIARSQNAINEAQAGKDRALSTANAAAIETNQKIIDQEQERLVIYNQQAEVLKLQAELIHKTGEATINLGDSFKQAFQVFFDTGNFNKAGQAFKDSFTKNFKAALAQSLVEKLGFDRSVTANFFSLGGVIKKLISGGITGGLNDGEQATQDSAKSIFDILGGLIGKVKDLVTGAGSGTQPGGPGSSNVPTAAEAKAGAPSEAGFSGLTGGQVEALIGAVVALGVASKGIADNVNKFSKKTLGDGKASTNLAALQGVNLAAFTATGAVAGALVGSAFPVIGTLIGAAVGAAIGAAVATAINKAITGAILNSLDAQNVRIGAGTQAQIQRKVLNSPIIKILGEVGSFGATAINGNKPLDISGSTLSGFSAFGGGSGFKDAMLAQFVEFINPLFGLIQHFLLASIPSIEVLLDKRVQQLLTNAGVANNRQLNQTLGQGTGDATKRAFVQQTFGAGGPLSGEINDLAQLFGALTGAGYDKAYRLSRIVDIIANSISRGNKNTKELEDTLDQIYRRVAGGTFVKAFQTIESIFRPNKDNQGPNFLNQINEITKAFQSRFPDVNLPAVSQIFKDEGLVRSPKANKQSRDIVRNSLSDLFQSGDFNTNFESFTAKLVQGAKDALEKGIGEAFFAQGPVGVVLAGFFQRIQKATKKALKDGGITDEEQKQLLDITTQSVSKAAALLGLMKNDIQRIVELNKQLDKILDSLRDPKEVAKSIADLRNQVRTELEKSFTTLFDLMNQKLKDQADLITKIAKISTPVTAATLGQDNSVIPEGAVNDLRQIVGQGIVEFNSIISQLSSSTQVSFLQNLNQSIDDFLSTGLNRISQLYSQALKFAADFQNGLKDATQSLLDFRTSQAPGESAQTTVSAIQREIENQRKILLSGDPQAQLDAANAIKDLNQKLLDTATAQLDQGSPAFAAARKTFESNLQDLQTFFGDQVNQITSIQQQEANDINQLQQEALAYYNFIRQHLPQAEQAAIDQADQTASQIISAITGTSTGTPPLSVQIDTAATSLLNAIASGAPNSLTGALSGIGNDITNIPFGSDLKDAFGALWGLDEEGLKNLLTNIGLIEAQAGNPPPKNPPPPPPGTVGPHGESSVNLATDATVKQIKNHNQTLQSGNTIQSADVLAALQRAALYLFDVSKMTPDQLPYGQLALNYLDHTVSDFLAHQFSGLVNADQVAAMFAYFRNEINTLAADPFFGFFRGHITGPGSFSSFFLNQLSEIKGLKDGGIVMKDMLAQLHGIETVMPLTSKGVGTVLDLMSNALMGSQANLQRLATIAKGGNSNNGDTYVTLAIHPGAFQANINGGDINETSKLPSKVVDHIITELKSGKLKKAVQQAVR